jgi:uncharacterized protein (UPF0261 family)
MNTLGERMPSRSRPAVVLIGTLDTKGPEIAFVAAELERLGCEALILDSGVRGEPMLDDVAVSRSDVAAAAGTTLPELQRLGRGDALRSMARGVERIVVDLASTGRIHGALCVGGAGVSLAVPAFQALDLGFPKLIVTPLASGPRTFSAFVDSRDVAVMHSVADIMGINPVTRPVLEQAAAYAAGAASARFARAADPGRADDLTTFVAASMNGNTTPALMRAKERLARDDVELVTFHANGIGGLAMEELVERRMFEAVLDFTTTELCGELVGGLMSAGPRRMEAAGSSGIPQVLVPGCVDFITTGPYDITEHEWPGRRLYRHNPAFTLVRLTAAEMAEVGRTFAEKANKAQGPTHICVPTGGLSVPDHPDEAFWDPDADAAFLDALEARISPGIPVERIDAHINDPVFVDRVVDVLLDYLPALHDSATPVEVTNERR